MIEKVCLPFLKESDYGRHIGERGKGGFFSYRG